MNDQSTVSLISQAATRAGCAYAVRALQHNLTQRAEHYAIQAADEVMRELADEVPNDVDARAAAHWMAYRVFSAAFTFVIETHQ